jgi:hypothetical protein
LLPDWLGVLVWVLVGVEDWVAEALLELVAEPVLLALPLVATTRPLWVKEATRPLAEVPPLAPAVAEFWPEMPPTTPCPDVPPLPPTAPDEPLAFPLAPLLVADGLPEAVVGLFVWPDQD